MAERMILAPFALVAGVTVILLVVTMVMVATAQMPRVLDALPPVYRAHRAMGAAVDLRVIELLRLVPVIRSGWLGYEHGGFEWPADQRSLCLSGRR